MKDTLVASTHIADSISCERKAILQDRVKVSSEVNSAIVYGNMAHELFQHCLTSMDFSDNCMMDQIPKIIDNYVDDIFLINETEKSAEITLSDFVPNIRSWGEKYVRISSEVKTN
jgi:DNA replication ATP-dependent helicase Dna2